MDHETPAPAPIHEVGERGAKWLRSKHASWVLAAISFAESLFAPILIDPFLIAFIFARREAWIKYTVISIIFSVLGGIAAFFLGALFYDAAARPILEFYHLTENFEAVAGRIDSSGFVFVLLGALTPIPYKLVAIAAGLFKMNFVTFLFASVIGRILRLGLVGIAAYAVGPHALAIIRKRLLLTAYVLAALLIVYIALRML